PQPGWEYAAASESGYVDRGLYAYWAARDPIPAYAARLQSEGTIKAGDLDRLKREAEAAVDVQARAVINAPWPDPSRAGVGVFADEPPRVHVEVLDPQVRLKPDTRSRRGPDSDTALTPIDPGPPVDAKGHTFLEAVMMGI